MASLGFAKHNKKIPIVILSSGKSAIETIDAIINSYLEKETIIVVCGYSRKKYTNFSNISNEHEVDIPKLLKNFTNFSYKITKTSELQEILHTLIRKSYGAIKGPIWIDVPIDILGKVNIKLNKSKIINAPKIRLNKINTKQKMK